MVPESRTAPRGKSLEFKGVEPELSVMEIPVQATVIEVILPDWESGWIGKTVRFPVYLSES